MTTEEVKSIIQSNESYRIELTISTTDKDKFQEAICAFANDMPGSRKKGYLLIGVKDNGELSGLKVDDELQKSISALRSTGNILPIPVMHCEKVEMEGGDVLVVEVTPSFSTPVRYRGRTFIRIGPRKDIASIEEERILTERCIDSLATFDVQPCREATLDDIDTDYIRTLYLPEAIDSEVLQDDHRSLKEQMASLRLYNTRFDCPTMAAIILFGNNPRYFMPGAYVQFVRFAGKTRADEVVNERVFKGGLFQMLPRLESFAIDAVVNQRPVAVSMFREKTVTNYPQAALRELLMNACMHRDYQSNTPIRFYQYEDRIELMNPGGLYGEARPENFPNVNAYRNPVVAEAMKNMKYVNMFNRGIRSVRQIMIQNGSEEPKFSVDKLTVFEVTLEDANVTDLRRYGNPNGQKADTEPSSNWEVLLPIDLSKYSNSIKALVYRIKKQILSVEEIQDISELLPDFELTYNQLTTNLQLCELSVTELRLGHKIEELRCTLKDTPNELLPTFTYFYLDVFQAAAKMENVSRKHIVTNIINPAIAQGLVTREHPETPRHPHQRYLLTPKGLEVLEAINKELSRDGNE